MKCVNDLPWKCNTPLIWHGKRIYLVYIGNTFVIHIQSRVYGDFPWDVFLTPWGRRMQGKENVSLALGPTQYVNTCTLKMLYQDSMKKYSNNNQELSIARRLNTNYWKKLKKNYLYNSIDDPIHNRPVVIYVYSYTYFKNKKSLRWS